ncbi:hypothetical protein N4R57_07190 [Rhodobacteraceae bacterium D3-12]|nr:hypothetical protein N4R57_07190 [Rhodobacteraceae bacterium D3-12]
MHKQSEVFDVIEECKPAQTASPLMRFSTEWLPERDRLDIWREEFARRVVRLEVAQLDDTPLLYDASFQTCGDVSVGAGDVSAISCTRSREMVSDGNGDIVMLIPLSGLIQAEQGMVEETIAPGGCLVRRSSEVGTTRSHAGQFLTLNLPVERLTERVADIDRLGMTVVPRDTEVLPLLQAYCRALCAPDATLRAPANINVVADHLLDLASLVIGARRDAWHLARGGGLRAARRLSAEAAIRRNAADPGYRIAHLASELNASESYVRKLLAEGGSVFPPFCCKHGWSLCVPS